MDYEEQLVNVMKWMYERGLTHVRGGNASIVDRSKSIVYITPTGKPRPLIERNDIALITLNGEIIRGRPSSEWRMHIAIYRAIEEAKAIVHGHPRNAVALVEARASIDPEILSEARHTMKCITIAPYRKPGTWELADIVAERLRESGCRAAIMERHGAVAYSTESAYHALDMLEALEDLSYITIYLKRL